MSDQGSHLRRLHHRNLHHPRLRRHLHLQE